MVPWPELWERRAHDGGELAHGVLRLLKPSARAPRALWRLDESSWTLTTGRVWQPVERPMLHLFEGPIETLPDGFGIQVYTTDSRCMLATNGMTKPEWSPALELHLILPERFATRESGELQPFVELLSVTAWFHNTQAKLNHGHTVNFGRSIISGSELTHGLLSLPYLDGPQLELLAEPPTRCLWLLPITARERDFKRDHGLEALEEIFEREELNYLALTRDSLV